MDFNHRYTVQFYNNFSNFNAFVYAILQYTNSTHAATCVAINKEEAVAS